MISIPPDPGPQHCSIRCRIRIGIKISVVDQDSLNPDPDPACQVNPDPVRIQFFDDQKFKKNNTAENFFLFFKKTSKLHVQEKPSALKREHPALKKFIKISYAVHRYKTFYFAQGSFLPSGSGPRSGLRILIRLLIKRPH